jgi:hypothetical protein
MSKVIVGIDPGKESYLCICRGGEYEFHQFPSIGAEIDIKGICQIFEENLVSVGDVHAVIEDVHAVYGSSAGATFAFGKIVGVLEALLYAYNVPFTKVQPKVWQKEMWQGVPIQTKESSTGKTSVTDTKLVSEMAAKRLFPNVDLRKSEKAKKSDHNKVDALLICAYGVRKFK